MSLKIQVSIPSPSSMTTSVQTQMTQMTMSKNEILCKRIVEEKYKNIINLKQTQETWESFYQHILQIEQGSKTQGNQMLFNFTLNNNLTELKLLSKINPKIIPNTTIINLAANYGYEEILEFIVQEYKVMPTVQATYTAAYNGHIHILASLAYNLNIFPNNHTMVLAVSNGHLEVIKFCVKNKIMPDVFVANTAVTHNQVPILEYLLSLKVPCIPEVEAINIAVEKKYNSVINVLAKHNIFPESARQKQIDILIRDLMCAV